MTELEETSIHPWTTAPTAQVNNWITAKHTFLRNIQSPKSDDELRLNVTESVKQRRNGNLP